MYTEELRSCPNCLSTLNGNENKCPNCSCDLKAFRNANSAGHTFNNQQNMQNEQQQNYNYTQNYNTAQQNNNYYAQNQGYVQSPVNNSNFGFNTQQNKPKKNTGVVLFLLIAFIGVASFVIFNAASSITGEADFSINEIILEESSPNFVYEIEFPPGTIYTKDMTYEDVKAHYDNASTTFINRQDWLDLQQEFTRAPDKEGERQYYYLAQSGQLARAIQTNEVEAYFKYDESFDIYSHDEASVNIFALLNNGAEEDDLNINIRLTDYYEVQNIYEYIIEHAIWYDDYTYEFAEIIDFGNGLLGYSLYEISDYTHTYSIYVPVAVENSSYLDVVEIHVDCSNYSYVDDEFTKIYNYDKLIKYLPQYFYIENLSAPSQPVTEQQDVEQQDMVSSDLQPNEEIIQEAQEVITGDRERLES